MGNHDRHDKDEAWNPKSEHGRPAVFHMPKKHKSDGKNETQCKNTQVFITLTNILEPNTPKYLTSRLLDSSIVPNEKIVQLATTAADDGSDSFSIMNLKLSAFMFLAILLSYHF